MATIGKKFEFKVGVGSPRLDVLFSILFSPDGWTITDHVADWQFDPSGPESLAHPSGAPITIPKDARKQLLDLHSGYLKLSDRLVMARLFQIANTVSDATR